MSFHWQNNWIVTTNAGHCFGRTFSLLESHWEVSAWPYCDCWVWLGHQTSKCSKYSTYSYIGLVADSCGFDLCFRFGGTRVMSRHHFRSVVLHLHLIVSYFMLDFGWQPDIKYWPGLPYVDFCLSSQTWRSAVPGCQEIPGSYCSWNCHLVSCSLHLGSLLELLLSFQSALNLHYFANLISYFHFIYD